MELRKLITFIRHGSALLYAISVLTESILFYMFATALYDLSFVLFQFVEFAVLKSLKCTLYPFSLSI